MKLTNPENADFKPSMLSDCGTELSPSKQDKLAFGDFIVCPDGKAYRLSIDAIIRNQCWTSIDNKVISISADPAQIAPIVSESIILVPQKSRWIKHITDSSNSDKIKTDSAAPFVTWSMMETFLTSYANKNFQKVKLTSNGSEAYVSEASSMGDAMSLKEASLHLVTNYHIKPAIVRSMLEDVVGSGNSHSFNTESYYIIKTAGMSEDAEDATIGYNEVSNRPPTRDFVEMPNIVENPQQLQQAITTAAENGIKEVFDVTAFKLLLRQNRFLEEVHDDLPLFMKCLNSLCRKLFLLYWHTKDFEDQYGTIKMKSLEESLKTTIDSLSEITIFFKMRTVDGDLGTGQDGGDLMQGHDL